MEDLEKEYIKLIDRFREHIDEQLKTMEPDERGVFIRETQKLIDLSFKNREGQNRKTVKSSGGALFTSPTPDFCGQDHPDD